LLFAAIALFFLWAEHQAHLLGALPYLVLLLCPLLHLLMHRGHGRDNKRPGPKRNPDMNQNRSARGLRS
jgi:hypothetical protein